MKFKSEKLYTKMMAATFLTGAVLTPAVVAPVANAEAASPFVVNNNVTTPDTVVYNGAKAKDTVKVYDKAGTKLIGSATTTKAGTITVTIKGGFKEDEIQVTLTSYNAKESAKVKLAVPEEKQTTQLAGEAIEVTNNVTIADTVVVTGATEKAVIKVYADADKKTEIGKATVGKTKEAKVTLKKGFETEKIYVTATNVNELESEATEKAVPKEKVTALPTQIKVDNNVTIADMVTVSGITPKSTVKVYADDQKEKEIGKAVANAMGEATVTIKAGFDTEKVYVTVTNINEQESPVKEAEVEKEKQTAKLLETNVEVANNVTLKDTLTVKAATEKATVKVYADNQKVKEIGKAVVNKAGEAVVTFKEDLTPGEVYVAIANVNEQESDVLGVTVEAEMVSTLTEDKITVVNNTTLADIVKVADVAAKATVKVYADELKVTELGKVTISKAGEAVVTIKAGFPDKLEKVYVTVTNYNEQESAVVGKSITQEAVTKELTANDIVVENNVTLADVVKVSKATEKATVKVYADNKKEKEIGKAVVNKAGEATVTIKGGFAEDVENIYVTVTNVNEQESSTVEKAVGKEKVTDIPTAVVVENNVTAADVVKVSGLTPKATFTVYATEDKTSLLGKAVVNAAGEATVTIKGGFVEDAEKVYVTATNVNERESEVVTKEINTESKSKTLVKDNVTLTNNVTVADTVSVKNAAEKATVKVYEDDQKTKEIGKAVVNKAGEAVVTIKNGFTTDNVYVTITNVNEQESDALTVAVTEEAATTFTKEQIKVENNVTVADTVTVTGVAAKATVKVFADQEKTTEIGKATASKEGDVVVTIKGGFTTDNVYVTLTDDNANESTAIEVEVGEEAVTDTLKAENVTVTNNVIIADTVAVTSATEKATITVYEDEEKTIVLGKAVVNKAGEAVVTIKNGFTKDKVYVTATDLNKKESEVLTSEVATEAVTDVTSLKATAVNNVTIADTVAVTGATEKATITVYEDETLKTEIGKAVVNKTGEAIVTIKAGLKVGKVYVTATNVNEKQSKAVEVTVEEEAQTTLSGDAVTVTNNVTEADSVTVTGVKAKATVKVYAGADKAKEIGKATASKEGDVVVAIKGGFAEDLKAVFVTLTNDNEKESTTVEKAVVAEKVSVALEASNVEVVNNVDVADVVNVTGATEKAVITVYNDKDKTKVLGTAVVNKTGEAVVTIKGNFAEEQKKAFVTVTNPNEKESLVLETEVKPEVQTTAPDTVTVQNNVDVADTVTVTGLTPKAVVTVYAEEAKTTALGTAVVNKDGEAVVTIKGNFTEAHENVFVAVKNPNEKESTPKSVKVVAETTTNVEAVKVEAVNNVDVADVVNVTGATEKATITVYEDKAMEKELGKAVVNKAGEATVTIKAGLKKGNIYAVVKNVNEVASAPIEVEVADEVTTSTENITATATNNVSIADSVTVEGVAAKAIVTVYADDKKEKVIGKATALKEGEVVVTIKDGFEGKTGNVYVTVTNTNEKESATITTAFGEEKTTAKLAEGAVVTHNNVSVADTVVVNDVAAKATVTVYEDGEGAKVLGTATASKEGEVVVTIKEGFGGLKNVFVAVKNDNENESDKLSVVVKDEVTTTKPTAIEVVNNVTVADVVTVKEVAPKATVNVYADQDKTQLLGTAIANADGETTVTMKKPFAVEKVFVTAQAINEHESTVAEAEVKDEAITAEAKTIEVANNVVTADTVTVKEVTPKATVKVYAEESKETLLGTAVVNKDGEAVVTIKAGFGELEKVFVTVTEDNKNESEVATTKVDKEAATADVEAASIEVANNVTIADTVTVKGLKAKDTVKVYSDAEGTKLLGTTTLTKDGDAVVTIKAGFGDLKEAYVTVTNYNSQESKKAKVDVKEEVTTKTLLEGAVEVVNNVTVADTVTVTGAAEKAVITVYADEAKKTVLAKATASKAEKTVVAMKKPFTPEQGHVYVTVTNVNEHESEALKVAVGKETTTANLTQDNVVVTNNVVLADTVMVKGVEAKDIIKVYEADGKTILGTATASKAGDLVVTLKKQLPNTEDLTIKVSKTAVNQHESEALEVTVEKEKVTEAVTAEAVTVVNNVVVADTITLGNVEAKTTVKVYAADGQTVLGTATASKTGPITLSLKAQLPKEEDLKIKVSVTAYNEQESTLTDVTVTPEEKTANPENIVVANNVTIADTVTVPNVAGKSVVKVYDATKKVVIGTATVSKNGDALVTIKGGLTVGNIYVTVTNYNKNESDFVEAEVEAEVETTIPGL